MGESEGTVLLFSNTLGGNDCAWLPILNSGKLVQGLSSLTCRCAPSRKRQLLGLHIPWMCPAVLFLKLLPSDYRKGNGGLNLTELVEASWRQSLSPPLGVRQMSLLEVRGLGLPCLLSSCVDGSKIHRGLGAFILGEGSPIVLKLHFYLRENEGPASWCLGLPLTWTCQCHSPKKSKFLPGRGNAG